MGLLVTITGLAVASAGASFDIDNFLLGMLLLCGCQLVRFGDDIGKLLVV